MRLISFDVGIKNLAYCVITQSNSQTRIPNWICANLLELNAPTSSSSQSVCNHMIVAKKKDAPEKQCGKHAKWRTPSSPDARFCETHAKMQTQWILPKKQHQPSQINKLKLPELKQVWSGISKIDAETISLKKAELVDKITTYYESVCFQTTDPAIKTATASETDLITIGRAIKQQLDSDQEIEGATHVIIENQISTIASRMKTIQGMIAQYFIMRFGDAVTIEFVSSHNKLKGFSQKPAPLDENSLNTTDKTKQTYKANKTDGVAICRRFIAANSEMGNWSPIFERSKKRDDLADCFLQGVWYLKANKLISYAEDLKINSVFVS